MSVQIAVRLNDDEVTFVDELVAGARVASRADAVRRGLALLRRQEDARREIRVLAAIEGPVYPDLEAMHDFLERQRPVLDD